MDGALALSTRVVSVESDDGESGREVELVAGFECGKIFFFLRLTGPSDDDGDGEREGKRFESVGAAAALVGERGEGVSERRPAGSVKGFGFSSDFVPFSSSVLSFSLARCRLGR